jgi:hypothetical protein
MLNKIVKIIGYIGFGLSAIVILHFFIADVSGLSEGLAKMEDMSSEMKVAEVDKLASGWSGTILNFSIAMFALCAVAAVGFALYQFVANLIDNPKSAIKSALIFGGVAVIVLISYSLASDTIPTFLGSDEIEITAATSKWIETFLFVLYFTFGLSIIAMLYNELSRLWK